VYSGRTVDKKRSHQKERSVLLESFIRAFHYDKTGIISKDSAEHSEG